MRIAIYGAGGMIGSRIAAEAAGRHHHVTRLSRSGNGPDGASTAVSDAADPAQVAVVAGNVDAVVSAIGPNRADPADRSFPAVIGSLADSVGTTRLLVVGGAGSLLVDGARLVDGPGFPPEYRSEGLQQADALDLLRGRDSEWVYVSPAPVVAPGTRTGKYVVGSDVPVGDSISAEDFAVAVVDELENPQHHRTRFTVAN